MLAKKADGVGNGIGTGKVEPRVVEPKKIEENKPSAAKTVVNSNDLDELIYDLATTKPASMPKQTGGGGVVNRIKKAFAAENTLPNLSSAEKMAQKRYSVRRKTDEIILPVPESDLKSRRRKQFPRKNRFIRAVFDIDAF
uniref:Uncharacterized protein n=1 Tax=Panagrolaimus sp. JU765 TaxID=591449 RepID=A0AC34R3R5_9BILA